MLADLSYTSEERDALWQAAEWTSIEVTRDVFEHVVGAYTNKKQHKLTPDDIRDIAAGDNLGRGTDPNANKAGEGKKPSGKGGRRSEERSSWLFLGMRIEGALVRGEEPFGVPEKIVNKDGKEESLVSKEQWEKAAIGGRIGENLIRFIAGVSAEQGAHFLSAQALINCQKRSCREVDVEITAEQLYELIDQKIMDVNVEFMPLVRFLYAANDMRKEDVAKKTTPTHISKLLMEEKTNQFSRLDIQTAADLLLPKGAEGEPNHDHLSMWFQKAREADRTFLLNILVNKILENLPRDEVDRQTFLGTIPLPESSKTLPENLLGNKNTLKLFIAQNFGDDHDSVTRFLGLLQPSLSNDHPLKNYDTHKIERYEPLIQRSEHLVIGIWAAVEGALENYVQGPMLKSELPRARQILQLLQWLDPRQDIKLSLPKTFEDEFGKNRYTLFFGAKLTPRSKEWQFFQKHFGLSDGQIEQLKQLPAGVDPKLNLPSPEYTLNHPEHYDTFGKWLKAMRETLGMSSDDVRKCLGVIRQMINKIESKGAEESFIKGKGKDPIPEQYLNADPYGIFPKDEHGNVTQEFRERFLALSKPNVMKQQYEEAKNWITHHQMMKELGLEWDVTLHREVLNYWRQHTIGVENGKLGTIAIQGGYIDVMRDTDGDLRFHKSSIDKLKADPEIREHLARQHNESRAR